MRNLLSLFLAFSVLSCSSPEEGGYSTVVGETMGTYYKVTYDASAYRLEQEEMDQLLIEINNEVSTYMDSSIISRFNRAEKQLKLDGSNLYSSLETTAASGHFMANFMAAKEIYQQTDGYFDPTVMPLVNYWGFGYTEKRKVTQVDSTVIDSLLQFVGFDNVHISMEEPYIVDKNLPGVQLDFSAIAKGYAVDELAELLERNSIEHYLVDIGGEIRAKGINAKGVLWTIGINTPKEDAGLSEVHTIVPINNMAIATSGNYRNFYEVEGVKYSHTINPQSGFPERSDLLSASVFAEDCMTADAFATAFMTMGFDKAFAKASAVRGLEALFIVGKPDGVMEVKFTEGLGTLFD